MSDEEGYDSNSDIIDGDSYAGHGKAPVKKPPSCRHREKFQCWSCQRVFLTLERLKYHIEVHLAEGNGRKRNKTPNAQKDPLKLTLAPPEVPPSLDLTLATGSNAFALGNKNLKQKNIVQDDESESESESDFDSDDDFDLNL